MSENFKISCSLKRASVWESKGTLDIILIIFLCKILTDHQHYVKDVTSSISMYFRIAENTF